MGDREEIPYPRAIGWKIIGASPLCASIPPQLSTGIGSELFPSVLNFGGDEYAQCRNGAFEAPATDVEQHVPGRWLVGLGGTVLRCGDSAGESGQEDRGPQQTGTSESDGGKELGRIAELGDAHRPQGQARFAPATPAPSGRRKTLCGKDMEARVTHARR